MRAAVASLVVTIVLAVTALLWTPVVVPRVEVLPTDFSTTVGASGTFQAFVLPGSLAKLPTPTSLPLDVQLQVAAVGGDDANVVVSSTQTQMVGAPGGATQDLTLKSQFVLDRRTTQNVDDPRAWSFEPTHTVNRAGTYSFTFGFDFDPARSYPFWDDSIGTSYPLAAGGDPGSAPTGGLSVTSLTGSTTQPADPAWIAALTPLQLPTSLTPEQWTAAGFTVTSTAPTVPVNYLTTLQTTILIDDESGATANLTQEVVTLAFRPDPAATGGTPATPLNVFITTVAESPASVTTDTQTISDNDQQIRLLTRTIPLAIGAAAVVFAMVSALLFVRHRRHAVPAA